MIWAVDQDDDANTLLSTVSASDLCAGGSGDSIKHKCVPIDDVSELRLVDSLSRSSQVRWWNPENSDETKQGRCGKYAPLIDGFYPVGRVFVAVVRGRLAGVRPGRPRLRVLWRARLLRKRRRLLQVSRLRRLQKPSGAHHERAN